MKASILLGLIILVKMNSVCQEYDHLVQYSKGFDFKEGIYLTIQDWKNNDPIPLNRISTKFSISGGDFFKRLLSPDWKEGNSKKLFSMKQVRYYDDNNEIQAVNTSKIFGYSDGNLVYTENHSIIPIIGSICHYTKYVIKGNRGGVYGIPNNGISYGKVKAKEFIIDFEKNQRLPFKKRHIEEIIKRDQELYKDYEKERGNRRQKLYKYLLEYNKKHPIYFPVPN